LNLSGYKLTFDDEFNTFSNSPSGNGTTWSTTLNGDGLRTLSSNGEQQFYSDSSVGVDPFSLQNGALTITAGPGSNPAGLPNNSGAIDTANSFNQQYGYFEMRAQLPAGQGMWPAFWLLTKGNWPPELDALEAFGAPNANGEGGTNKMHYGAISHDGSQSAGNWVDTGMDLTAGFHTYGVNWDPQHLTYYVDGQQVAQVNTPADANVPMYMIANLAAGGNWPGSTAGNTAQLQIDYIRAYSNDPNANAVALDTVSAPDNHDPGMYGASAANAAPSSTPASAPSSTPALAEASAPAPAPSSTPAPAPSSTPAPAPSSTPASGQTSTPVTTGSGTDTLTLHLSGDAWHGDAQFVVTVDGKSLGAAQSVTASHGAGQTEDFTFNGDFGSGAHQVAVTFVNDEWGGTTGTDRNLYVDGAEFNGQQVATTASLMYTGATDTFAVTGTASNSTGTSASSTSSGTQTSSDSGTGTTTAGSGSSTGSTTTTTSADGTATAPTDVAQATPTEARGYVVSDASGTAHGTAGAEDIYATADGQTLIGGGGDDVFHIGGNTHAQIVVGNSGVTTVSTWAANYTLASGVNNLSLEGNYAHNVTGNGMDNYIVGSDGNDTIHGGGGNVTIAVGTGANSLTGGGQHDTFVFSKAADHDNVIHDFTAGHDLLDLKGAVASTGYTGSDAVADHVLSFVANASGGTNVVIGSGSAAHTLVTLEHVAPTSLHAGTDYVWH
jgi:beta-glucanase (GH16 family)